MAVQKEKELEEKIKFGYSLNAKLLFYDYSPECIERRKDELKPNTVISYQNMNEAIKDQIGYLRLEQITSGRLTALYDWLAEEGRNKRNGGKLSKKTIREYHMFISSVMGRALKQERIVFNPCEKAEAPKREKHRAEIFQPDEVSTMLSLLEKEPLKWQVYIHLLLVSGARRGEIAELK